MVSRDVDCERRTFVPRFPPTTGNQSEKKELLLWNKLQNTAMSMLVMAGLSLAILARLLSTIAASWRKQWGNVRQEEVPHSRPHKWKDCEQILILMQTDPEAVSWFRARSLE